MLLFAAALLFAHTPHAFASANLPTYTPEFAAYQAQHPLNLSSVAFPNANTDTIRVLIFPHIGPYSTPQGRESNFDEVSFRSKQECELFSDAAMTKLLKKAASLRFQWDEVAGNGVFLRCNAPTTLVREKSLTSYEYQGVFHIHGHKDKSGEKSVRVIQIVPFETYLKGVVPAEMPSNWPAEALKAQAIAARSYALFQINVEELSVPAREYDLDDTVFYQAYLGLSYMRPSTDAAVEGTTGQALRLKGDAIPAFFSADSGGYTELGENVWKINCPFCVSKPEAYDLKLVPSDWSNTFTLKEIEDRLRDTDTYTGTAHLTSLTVQPGKINQSGRVMEARLGFSDGKILNLFGPTFQRILHFRSNLFTVREIHGDNGQSQFVFDGRGFGHGVGMNQWGARVLAQNYGWDHQRILFFYFQKVEIR